MKPELWITLGNLVLTAIGLYFGPKLAVKRSLEQFRSQKWWERQHDTYTHILEDLSTMFAHHASLCDEITQSIKYSPSTETWEQIRIANNRLELTSITGAYLISERAAVALKEYNQVAYKSLLEREQFASAEMICDAAKTCMEIVKAEAKAAIKE